MPLHILLILVAGGIAGIALALHLLGLSQAPAFTRSTARAAWLRARPDDTVLDVVLTRDGRAARITTDHGAGLLWQMGADSCARLLTGQETLRIKDRHATLLLGDYAAPRVRLSLSPEDAKDWQDWIART
ncbi:hypothetical protein [uncultured Tateyamaria sp.]|uniref:hypothetical protein n=1 Tax=uncultured Tateyamaria sp. TaxID=455651 RepID=UPI0026386C75|nr:hypothetical protein [uncultured Tateyamaria sp.]